MKSRVAEWIDRRGLKNNFVAKRLGVSQVQVSKWRTGRAYPRLEKAFELARLLEVKVDDLYVENSSTDPSENDNIDSTNLDIKKDRF